MRDGASPEVTQAAEDRDTRRRKLEAALGIPFFTGNAVTVLRNGKEIFPAMLKAVEEARRTIRFLTFVYWTGDIADRMADALSDRAAAGVDVKVLLDAFGAKSMRQELIDRMEKGGVEIAWFRPLSTWRLWAADNRTHRKILVVDDEIGFTGGVGIAREWEGDARDPTEWRDTHFRVEGPAVRGLAAGFLGNWSETGRRVDDDLSADDLEQAADGERRANGTAIQVVRSTATIGWSDVATLMQALVDVARRRLAITTPYFMPDDRAVAQLREAVARGVEVEVMIPGRHVDKRVSELAGADYYTSLIEAGVRLWRYQKTMLHAKVITVDGAIACVGSPNFNRRSMRKDDEIALVMDDPAVTGILDDHFAEDLKACERVDGQTWERRGLGRRVVEAGARLLRPHV